ncbi:MAG: PilZ domain-containing protein [Cellvibrionaceae bacterium]|nr:PilZ domain-containing protein [Cellvibrionaceae bacterium]
MRNFIRHPTDIPLTFTLKESESEAGCIHGRGQGGLCFDTDMALAEGAPIHIEIPLSYPPFSAKGCVAWCRPEGELYNIGVCFDDQSTLFNLRMVEQVCHIEHYRKEVLEKDGRQLSEEEAAREWVEKFADKFPSH